MQTIYIYKKETLENIAQPVVSNFEEFELNPAQFYPDWDNEAMLYTTSLFTNPTVDKGQLREMSKDELYKVGRYTLAENELVENGKIKTVELSKYEYIENNEIKFKRDEKVKDIENELYNLRLEKEVSPFEFEINGNIYLQQNRSIDQSNITKVLFQMIIMFLFNLMTNAIKGEMPTLSVIFENVQKLSFKNWKFYTENGTERYEAVSVMKFMEMSQKMNLQTTISMVTETELKHKLVTLSDEEIRNFDTEKEYIKRYDEEMAEALK